MVLLGSVILIIGLISLLLGYFMHHDITRYLTFSICCGLLGLALISINLKLLEY